MTYPAAATRWDYYPAHDVSQMSDVFEEAFRQMTSRCDILKRCISTSGVLTGGGDLPYDWATALLLESVRGNRRVFLTERITYHVAGATALLVASVRGIRRVCSSGGGDLPCGWATTLLISSVRDIRRLVSTRHDNSPCGWATALLIASVRSNGRDFSTEGKVTYHVVGLLPCS